MGMFCSNQVVVCELKHRSIPAFVRKLMSRNVSYQQALASSLDTCFPNSGSTNWVNWALKHVSKEPANVVPSAGVFREFSVVSFEIHHQCILVWSDPLSSSTIYIFGWLFCCPWMLPMLVIVTGLLTSSHVFNFSSVFIFSTSCETYTSLTQMRVNGSPVETLKTSKGMIDLIPLPSSWSGKSNESKWR